MSMGKEWLDDHAYELYHPHQTDFSVWHTKDGRTLKITEMTTEHIKNCMNMLGEENPYWQHFAKEILRRNGVEV